MNGSRRMLLGTTLMLTAFGCSKERPFEPTPDSNRSPGAATSGLIEFTPPDGFVELGRFERIGSRAPDGGCHVLTQERLGSGERSSGMLVRVDTLTCRFVFARGTWPALRESGPTRGDRQILSPGLLQRAPVQKAHSAARTTELVSGAPLKRDMRRRHSNLSWEWWGSPPGCSTEFSDFGTAWQKLWFVDPIFAILNTDENTVDWNFDGYCVQWWRGIHYGTTNTGSGWSIELFESTASTGPGSQYVDHLAWARHRNSSFCIGQPATIAHYTTNGVRVFYDGYAIFNRQWHASGGCVSFLTAYWDSWVW